MSDDPVVLGVGMHPFGKFPDRGLRELGYPAIREALKDAGVSTRDIEIAYVSNAVGGLVTGQECVRGQVVLRYAGFTEIPVVNVENACAGGGTALFQACMAVRSGLFEVALALGVEKLYTGDTARSLRALATAAEVDVLARTGVQFTALYAMKARQYMERWGAEPRHLALVVVKNSRNGAANPNAQFRRPLQVEEVLQARPICEPLTLTMCSSMADGAAAAIVCSPAFARRRGVRQAIRVAASVLTSGSFDLPLNIDETGSAEPAAAAAYEQARLGPADLDLYELHDAAASAEFEHMEAIGLCPAGRAFELVERGETERDGRFPVNPSGGLLARGHAVGATGIAQVAEAVWQLRGQAGDRQVRRAGAGEPRAALCLNTGGRVGDDRAAYVVHILVR